MDPHWKNILPVDRYIVRQNGLIQEYDRKILTLLYQPLIGATAYSLYMTLWSILDQNAFWGKESTHHSLMTITGLPLQKIYQERKKLEGFGLLQTYVKEGDEARTYLYEMQPPLSPEQFFKDDLHIFLHSQLGKNRYVSLKRYFSYKTKDEDDFRPVTASFNEVFDSVRPSEMAATLDDALELDDDHEWISRKQASTADFSTEDFDFELLMTHLSNLIVPKEAITDELKEVIAKLAFIYNIEPLEMSKRIENAYIKRDQLDQDLLSKEVQDWYLFEQDNQFPTLVFRNQPLHLQTMKGKKPSDKEEALIQALETRSPVEMLEEFAEGSKPPIADLKIIEAIMFEQKLTPAVVNALIYYIVIIKEKILNKNYVEKIANDWVRKKVKTVPEAIELCREEHKKYQQRAESDGKTKGRPPRKNQRTEKLPEWIANKDKENKEPSPDWDNRKKQLEERMKKYKKTN